MVQFSHPYITTGKTVALTIQTFVGKVMSFLFNMLSWFVIAFLPRSKQGAEGYSNLTQICKKNRDIVEKAQDYG